MARSRSSSSALAIFFFFQAEDGIRDLTVTGVQTCALPISQQESELGVEVAQDLTGDDRLPGRECEVPEQTRRRVDGERGELGDREAADPHGERGGLEPRAAAGRARGLAPVARQKDAHVELVTVRLDLLEEPLDAGEAPVALVDERARLGGKRLPGRVGVELVPARGLQQRALIPLARGMRPRLDGPVGQALAPIAAARRLVAPQQLSETLAL